MTRDALLAAVPSRLGDIRWLALAYQAYVDAARLSDAYSRVYRVERRLQQSLADMEMEVMKSGGESQHGQEVCAAALRLSREAGAAARDGAAAADHVQRAEVMLAAVMGDLASVLVGFNAQVGNIRFASVEAALLAADHEINEGRSRSARALDSAALCEDRVLLVQLNRIGVESPHQNALFEQEAADLLGVAPEQLHALRSDGLELGDAVALLALSQDIGKEAHEVVAAFHRLQVFRSLQPGWPVSCIDGILEQHGRADLIEIMLRQVFYTINEEKQSA
jgi:hypothetical protein